ncbi:MAG: InlB B-repeat-containing protein, partial [Clostridiales Family XIII bacterium]|nr:InlB B-repeat-containing protein [Clostridiales Family XIII bacterium]
MKTMYGQTKMRKGWTTFLALAMVFAVAMSGIGAYADEMPVELVAPTEETVEAPVDGMAAGQVDSQDESGNNEPADGDAEVIVPADGDAEAATPGNDEASGIATLGSEIETLEGEGPEVVEEEEEEPVTALVKFKSSAGGDEVVIHTVVLDIGATLAQPPADTLAQIPVGDGELVSYWYLEGDAAVPPTPFVFGGQAVTEDITLLPYVTSTVLVTFQSGGTPVAYKAVEKGQPVAAPDPAPVRSGYHFLYWTLDSDASKQADERTPYDFAAPVEAPLELFAVWEGENVGYRVVMWLEKENLGRDPESDADYDYYSTFIIGNEDDMAKPVGTVFGERFDGDDTEKGNAEVAGLLAAAQALGQDFPGAYPNDNYWASLARLSSPALAGDGSTIVNAYFDREVFTMTFDTRLRVKKNHWDYETAGGTGQRGTKDSAYAATIASGGAVYGSGEYTLSAKVGDSIGSLFPIGGTGDAVLSSIDYKGTTYNFYEWLLPRSMKYSDYRWALSNDSDKNGDNNAAVSDIVASTTGGITKLISRLFLFTENYLLMDGGHGYTIYAAYNNVDYYTWYRYYAEALDQEQAAERFANGDESVRKFTPAGIGQTLYFEEIAYLTELRAGHYGDTITGVNYQTVKTTSMMAIPGMVGAPGAAPGTTVTASMWYQILTNTGKDYGSGGSRNGTGTTGVDKAYRFDRYYMRATAGVVFDKNVAVGDEASVTAFPQDVTGIKYGANIYNSLTADAQAYLDGDLMPQREGYSFAGWYMDDPANEGARVFTLGEEATMPQNNLIVFAKWVKEPCTVSFYDAIGGAHLVGSDITVEAGRTISDPGIYTAGQQVAGKGEFVAWIWLYEGKHAMRFGWDNQTIGGDMKLYALWKVDGFSVAYELGEGTGTAPVDGDLYALGKTARVMGAEGIVPPAGKVFTAWAVKGAEGVTKKAGDYYSVGGSTVFVPLFEDAGDVVALTFHPDFR